MVGYRELNAKQHKKLTEIDVFNNLHGDADPTLVRATGRRGKAFQDVGSPYHYM